MEIDPEMRRFISANINSDPNALRLKYLKAGTLGFDAEQAITQIECRQKCKSKLARLLAHEDFLFPSTLAAEQSTGELLAEYHASLVSEGCTLLDMTGGLGIDDIFLSRRAARVRACELKEATVEVARHNAKVLGIKNLEILSCDSLEHLRQCAESYDTIFVDPARRMAHNRRAYAFSDCTPDIVANYELIRSKANSLIVKASPMLDIAAVRKQLPDVSEIQILSVKNECKEIVCVCRFGGERGPVMVKALNFESDTEEPQLLEFVYGEEMPCENYLTDVAELSEGGYIYEPNASIMKSGGYAWLNRSYALTKLHPNTHLYYSAEGYEQFPGRRFEIERVMKPGGAEAKQLQNSEMNIATRNYPLTAEQLAKKLKIRSRAKADRFLLAARATVSQQPILIVGKR